MTPTDDLWLVTLEGAIAICTVAASWGASKSRGKAIEKRLDAIEEKYVTRAEFVAAFTDIKESQRESRDDIRRLLDIVSKRGRA